MPGDLEEENEFFRPMHRLVEHIAAQPYAPLLFCTTSMQALLVAQHAEIGFTNNSLRSPRRGSARMKRLFPPSKGSCENRNGSLDPPPHVVRGS
jgi:hypothetical protein